MTVELTARVLPATSAPSAPSATLRARLRERRWLREHDLRSAQLAGLHQIRGIIARAHDVIGEGWVQHAWFTCREAGGRQQAITAHNAHLLTDHSMTQACLVGAILHAGGGLPATRSEPVQRALDLTWHTLYRDPREPVHWCPAPPVRATHVRDLTRWNDDPRRTASQVSALLIRTRSAVDRETEWAFSVR